MLVSVLRQPVLSFLFIVHDLEVDGPLAWNSLPADLQNIPDTSSFKKRLKTFLFYSAF